ncbi:MAG: two-component regulator propeller domain-containing protein [Acidobacteriota bacterium]
MKAVISLSRPAILLAALLAFLVAPLVAQRHEHARFSRLGLEDGLSQAHVSSFLQDNRGFIWLATEDGLNRYDGRSVVVYKHDSQDPSSLENSWVGALLESSDGSILVGTNGGGVDRWKPATNDFERLLPPSEAIDPRVRALAEDTDGNLWIGTENGLYRRSPAGEILALDEESGLAGSRVNTIFAEDGGVVWVGTRSGLSRWVPESDSFVVFEHDAADDTSLPFDDVRSILRRADGNLWVGTYGGGIACFDEQNENFTRYSAKSSRGSLSSGVVHALFEDDQGTLWIATDDGLNLLGSETDATFRVLRNDPLDRYSLSSNRTRAVYQDRGGVIWIGTQSGGASWFNPKIGYFPRYRIATDLALSSDTTASFLETENEEVWVGSVGGGLDRVDLETRSVRNYGTSTAAARLADDRIMALESDGRGGLWIGTFGGGLDHLDPETDEVINTAQGEGAGALSAAGVMSLYQDGEGVLWIGTFGGGLNRRDVDGSIMSYTSETSELSDDLITVIEEDVDGTLWIGTRFGGLNRFERGTGPVQSYRHDPQDPRSLASDVVTSLHVDSKGRLWIGTEEGLHEWSLDDRQAGRTEFRIYSEGQGLPNQRVWGILEDDAGMLWVSTNRGIARIDAETGAIRTYDESRGLQSAEFNFGAAHRGPSGRLYFGGVQGFNAFDAKSIRSNEHVPPVVFTSVRKLNQPIELDRPVWELEELELDHRDSVVTIGFAALDFTAPHLNRYQYKLEGLQDEWIELEDSPRATFAKLSPGSYTLRLRASNNEGVWNDDGATLRMKVHPPFWNSNWAWIAYIALGVGAMFYYARSQAAKLRHEENYSRQLEAKVRERTQELEEATVTDPLTGLKNRRYLMTTVAEELRAIDLFNSTRAAEERPRNLLFLMVDLDGLKQINDTYGHSCGDNVIKQMRDILQGACRETDTVIRMGGDEFLIVGRDVNRQTAEILAERVRTSVEDNLFDLGEDGSTALSCSIGFAFYPFVDEAPERVTGDQVVTIADRALYVAKTSGRNAWVGIHGTGKTLKVDLSEALQSGLQTLVAREALIVGASLGEGDLVWGQEAG